MASRLTATKSGIARSCGKRQCNRRFSNPTGPASRIYKGYRDICINRKWVPEHRLVIERRIGRSLLSSEHVHHINGDRLDNRLENLEVVDQSTHSRQHADVLRELIALKAATRPIPVSERLPEVRPWDKELAVLVWLPEENGRYGQWYKAVWSGETWWEETYDASELPGVTHWLPLPPPVKEQQ